MKIIEPEAYSDWALPIVPVLKKYGKMRVNVNLRDLVSRINIAKYPLLKLKGLIKTAKLY